ncbi:MAG: hypothetical protein ACAH80_05325 [Alphaproteobacteria bacterium]
MTTTLEEVRTKLYKAFDAALALKDTSMSSGNNCDHVNARANAIQAAAQAAQAISVIENQLQVKELLEAAKNSGAQVVLEISQGLVKDVKPMAAIKLKQPGTP